MSFRPVDGGAALELVDEVEGRRLRVEASSAVEPLDAPEVRSKLLDGLWDDDDPTRTERDPPAGGGSVLGRAVVRGVPRDDLDRVGTMVDGVLGDRPAEGAAYVDGAGLVSTVGVGATYRLFERLRRRHRPDGPWVCGSLPGAARETTVAGVGDDGELRPLEPTASDDVLAEDRRLDLLRQSRRRALLRALDGAEGRVGVDRLAALVAERLEDPGDRLELLLYQTDLPNLERHGVVAFDAEEGAAALRPQALQLWPLLSATDRR